MEESSLLTLSVLAGFKLSCNQSHGCWQLVYVALPPEPCESEADWSGQVQPAASTQVYRKPKQTSC